MTAVTLGALVVAWIAGSQRADVRALQKVDIIRLVIGDRLRHRSVACPLVPSGRRALMPLPTETCV